VAEAENLIVLHALGLDGEAVGVAVNAIPGSLTVTGTLAVPEPQEPLLAVQVTVCFPAVNEPE
jgi:hypothetical protein